jgi:L-lactate dehydrogenase complex protein LldG
VKPIENPSRERILARLRAALRVPAPRHPGRAGEPFFAPVEDLLACFQKECAGNNTECVVASGLHACAEAVANVLAGLPPGEIFVQDTRALHGMARMWPAVRPVRWSNEGGPGEGSQAAVTMAEMLVAATGSVLVSAGNGGRGASIIAPVHIVVAGIEQLVPDLDAAFARAQALGASPKNSFLCLITGSSRTADIEKVLVLGAHGPRRLVVVLVLHLE